MRPGVCDHHGKPVSPGILDDLFGIKRAKGKGIIKDANAKLDTAFEAFKPNLELTGLSVDGDVQVAGGTALGSVDGAPILIVKRTGKGLTALLNYGFNAPYKQRTEPSAVAQWDVLHGLMALNGVKPQVRVTMDGDPLRKLEIVRYQDGPVQYLAFRKERVNSDEQNQTATIRTTKKLHTYDVRAGKYLGNVQEWQAEFVPARAKLYARLPYAVEGLELEIGHLGPPAEGAGEILELRVKVAASGDPVGPHWVNVRIFGDEDRELKHYMRNVPTEIGLGSVQIPMPVDAIGTRRIVARDVTSGKTAEAEFRLLP